MIGRRDCERGRKGGGVGCDEVVDFVVVEGGFSKYLILDQSCGIELSVNDVIWVGRELHKEKRKVEKKVSR